MSIADIKAINRQMSAGEAKARRAKKEMVEASKNTMYFTALAQRTTKEFSKLKYLLRSTGV